MGVWDEKIAPKGGGTANAQFRFSVSYADVSETLGLRGGPKTAKNGQKWPKMS